MHTLRSLLLITLLVSVAFEFASACDCSWHPGGCVISRAPAEGYKCKCRYKGLWTCGGREKRCHSDERCPGNCKSLECCKLGGGNCGGY